ncbi:uncharacterized protein LOC142531407 [Primulina tabacum]|uniref:uncharacterized protein LOC142531407 n=1 Tax=Primulina tabacum TaxID=48773 RepID=UPI003F5A985D
MRIRKNAKISPLIYAAASLNPGILAQPRVCQLNQSPWDVMNFSQPSSPPYKGNGNGSYAGNGSSQDSIAVLERAAEESSNAMKWEYSGGISGGAAATMAEQPSDELNNSTAPIILCCKTDGKSWKCRREAVKGNSLCDHHLSMVRSYSSSAHTTARNSSKPVAERRRPRIKKSAVPSSSNPYVFYYYSGFGPRWGKKRGEDRTNGTAGDTAEYLDRGHHMEPLNLSETDENFDYKDEDDDNEDEDPNKKKRTRKRVKARSLKSLI